MKKYTLVLLALYASQGAAGEGHGIEPWQDANQAQKLQPVPMVSRECEEGLSIFGEPEKHCEVITTYVWVPDLSGILAPETITAMFCLRLTADRLVQCFYRKNNGETAVIPIKYRGETV